MLCYAMLCYASLHESFVHVLYVFLKIYMYFISSSGYFFLQFIGTLNFNKTSLNQCAVPYIISTTRLWKSSQLLFEGAHSNC